MTPVSDAFVSGPSAMTRSAAAQDSSTRSSRASSPMYASGISAGVQTRLRGDNTSISSHGSRTMVMTAGSEEEEEEQEQSQSPSEPDGVLYLRGEEQPGRGRAQVRWTEDTVDNEHMNKKKSKVCCIFRKQRMFGESDSESDSDCSSCSGDDSPNEYERMPSYATKRGKAKGSGKHRHSHGGCNH
ncbi:Type 1 phosphatases regulator ypi1 [Dipsacomyces acuminosporus]|nr:Type 1 phosphatases regulator ypi1 [Dipsacomyces acuminosporus]